ncbi:MAG: ABC transporter permease [Chloroflexi bacterium]|nr:ABC transporter permease [Chloroflexota bacterium]
MSRDRTLAIASRVMRQIIRDRRTLALLVVVPVVVMSLVGLSFTEESQILDSVAPALLATFAMFFVFILTGVSFLRERMEGTLERLLATPVGRTDVILGYLLGFLLFAALQATIILLFTIGVLKIHYAGALWEVFVFLMALTIGSVNLGIFVSTYARNEFQVMQFIPLVLAPQIFLSGIFLPVEEMPGYLQGLAKVLPLTHAVEGLREIMLHGKGLGDVITELAVLVVFAVIMLILAATTVRRV